MQEIGWNIYPLNSKVQTNKCLQFGGFDLIFNHSPSALSQLWYRERNTALTLLEIWTCRLTCIDMLMAKADFPPYIVTPLLHMYQPEQYYIQVRSDN